MTNPATTEQNVTTSSQEAPVVVRTPPPPLKLDGATVRFGGIVALNDVSFTVEPGTIHAVIGPNGAGKSTCFNAITGVYKLASGKITLGNTVLSNTAPHKIASLGLGRAFQNLALSPTSTVLDNVMLGRHSLMKGGFFSYGLRLPWVMKNEKKHLERAAEICDFLGISQYLHKTAGLLSYGDQKRVDIARALASEPKVLMLDEPAAGMNATETAEIAQLIHDVRDELQISILLVEHDMALVMDVADHVTVLDFGKRIADDIPTAIQKDPAVIRAYLGAPEDEVAQADAPRHASDDDSPAAPDDALDGNDAAAASRSEDSQ